MRSLCGGDLASMHVSGSPPRWGYRRVHDSYHNVVNGNLDLDLDLVAILFIFNKSGQVRFSSLASDEG
ncbi:hypothetical protein TIFTF001_027021 [Ficus carica]|uniref:Uncharacterized protein n=1 Tax=Ficus carica TaxID=3494 RepID=A0AA88DM86_FICCA|nr:hypothetical protein TIFTF001_027021 [Ficus carica]